MFILSTLLLKIKLKLCVSFQPSTKDPLAGNSFLNGSLLLQKSTLGYYGENNETPLEANLCFSLSYFHVGVSFFQKNTQNKSIKSVSSVRIYL